MPERQSRFQWVVTFTKIWSVLGALLVVAAFAGGTILLVLCVREKRITEASAFAVWVVALAALPAAALWVVILRGLLEVVVRNQEGVQEVADHVKRLESLTEALYDSSRRLLDLTQMSETAKSLLYRQRELEAMNEVLHEHLIRQDYASAEKFVSDIEKHLGYAGQVERMRKEVAEARSTSVEQKIDSALNRVNRSILAHDWAQAFRQANRLMQLVPDNPKVAPLLRQIHEARAAHKRELLQAYGEAVKRSDIDRSIELIHQLDKYLTPQEAAALEESARGVFRAKLHNLGVQFAIRVTEEQWDDAVAIGQQIIEEYPNSRMAREVSERMDQLRALAEQKRAAAGQQE